jgi:hypothetical protein
MIILYTKVCNVSIEIHKNTQEYLGADMLTHNNQTAKADAGKPRLTLVPTGIIKAVEKVRRYGNEKYHDPHCPADRPDG